MGSKIFKEYNPRRVKSNWDETPPHHWHRFNSGRSCNKPPLPPPRVSHCWCPKRPNPDSLRRPPRRSPLHRPRHWVTNHCLLKTYKHWWLYHQIQAAPSARSTSITQFGGVQGWIVSILAPQKICPTTSASGYASIFRLRVRVIIKPLLPVPNR